VGSICEVINLRFQIYYCHITIIFWLAKSMVLLKLDHTQLYRQLFFLEIIIRA